MKIDDVAVTCTARSHAPRVAHITAFRRVTGEPRIVGWNENHGTTLVRRSPLADQERNRPTAAHLWNDSTEPPGREAWDGTPARNRYRLECRLCGLAVAVRDDRLGPALDHCADAGITTLDLAALARIIS